MIDIKTAVDINQINNMEVETDEDSDALENQEPLVKINKKRKVIDDNGMTKKKGKLKKDLYRQPTVEELNQLRETENLFHSNLIRLQIEEILKAVKLKDKYRSLFDVWFDKFKNDINSIDTRKVELDDDKIFEDSNITIPIKKVPNDYVGSFTILPPSNIIVGGSYALDTIVGPNTSIDILVEMSENQFQKRDLKNYRYMRKKAIYLAYLASNINEQLAEKKCFIGTDANPILKIVPPGDLSKYVVMYIHIVAQETAVIMNKLTPEKNNVKPAWFFKNDEKTEDVKPATPFYNNIILYDTTTLKTNVESIELIKNNSNIKDGIKLLKIWLKQQDYSNNFESFNGHIITMYVLYLLCTKKLNIYMSSYQIVRNVWQHLANSDWCTEGISLCQDEKMKDRITEFHKYYDCVFLDSTGFHNLAANIFAETFKWVSSKAKMSIDCLNNTRINSFQILFMRKVPFYKIFDHIICIYNIKALENILDQRSNDDDKLNYGPNKYTQAVKFILKLLKQGLGDRISLINVLSRKVKEWQMTEEVPNDLERIYIGFNFDQVASFKIIEKGPNANVPEAEKFRKFWGAKSDLRRFKDGTICEAVVWAKENATIAERRQIPSKIIKFLFEEKLKLFENKHFFFYYNQAEEFLELKRIAVTKFRYGTEEATQQVISVFDEVEKALMGLNDLPLTVSGVQGCSALFRYADVFPPLSSVRRPDGKNVVPGENYLLLGDAVEEVPTYLLPVEATLQLATSGKWPDDLEAMRMTKAAFYLQIAESLRNQHKLRAFGSLKHLDVMKDGFVFRLRIAHQKEISLLKQVLGEDGVLKYRDNEESLELEEKLFHLPRLTGALHGLHCEYPSFGPACCLAKRWLSAELIDDSHMPELAVELIMASLYLNPDPYTPAQAPQVAFVRFLEMCASEFWSTDPIIVNFNNELTSEEIVEIENTFGTSRDSLPALFISTPYDKQASALTRKIPQLVILNRISGLAKECLRVLETQIYTRTNVTFHPLFRPPLSSYDCLIQLRSSFMAHRLEALALDGKPQKRTLHPYKEHSQAKVPIVGFDPVAEYLAELRNIYSEFALFFHDTYGGNIIGVLLKPNALDEKDFKVTNTNCRKLNGNNKLVLNLSAMIEDFYIIGKGLVETINIQSKKINTT